MIQKEKFSVFFDNITEIIGEKNYPLYQFRKNNK